MLAIIRVGPTLFRLNALSKYIDFINNYLFTFSNDHIIIKYPNLQWCLTVRPKLSLGNKGNVFICVHIYKYVYMDHDYHISKHYW